MKRRRRTDRAPGALWTPGLHRAASADRRGGRPQAVGNLAGDRCRRRLRRGREIPTGPQRFFLVDDSHANPSIRGPVMMGTQALTCPRNRGNLRERLAAASIAVRNGTRERVPVTSSRKTAGSRFSRRVRGSCERAASGRILEAVLRHLRRARRESGDGAWLQAGFLEAPARSPRPARSLPGTWYIRSAMAACGNSADDFGEPVPQENLPRSVTAPRRLDEAMDADAEGHRDS